MIAGIEQVLYIDIQAKPMGKLCRLCGRNCYGWVCLRCERDMP